jgi:hypothetical protein
MDIQLLFRKSTPLIDDHLPWLAGSEEHRFIARRNPSGRGIVSAILVRALMSTLEGNVLEAYSANSGDPLRLVVRSLSRPGSVSRCWLDWSNNRCGIPHGELTKVTYHLGVLVIVQALTHPVAANDFWKAYASLMQVFRKYGRSGEIKEALCRAADELYYLLRYGTAGPDASHSRLEALRIGPQQPGIDILGFHALDLSPLTDPEALNRLLGDDSDQPDPNPIVVREPARPGGFIGWQAQALAKALAAGDNILLAGPTGTGKTYALQQVIQGLDSFLVTIEGKEGLTDLDFLGAILPQEDGTRQWVDGPLLRAMRQARLEPVLLFLDEVNRIPRVHLNLLLGLMNPKSKQACQQMGMQLRGDGPFYIIETPMTSEVVACPVRQLRIVAAGNFGRLYQVYDLDPAVRRRFDTVIEFDYLEYQDELNLLHREVPGVSDTTAEVLVKLAQETRRLVSNGELPGCIDTASLLNWGRKCAGSHSSSLKGIMQSARLAWADIVCGRDHTGRINQGSLKALEDYLESLALLKEA